MTAPAAAFSSTAGANAATLINSSLIQIYRGYLPPSLLIGPPSLPWQLRPALSEGREKRNKEINTTAVVSRWTVAESTQCKRL